MTTFRRVAAAATLTAGLGLGLAAPASAQVTVQPGPINNPGPSPIFYPCRLLGGTFTPAPAYPPAGPGVAGTCSYTFPGLTIIGSGNQIQFNFVGLAPFTLVFGPLFPGGPVVRTTADANGTATVSAAAEDVPAGDLQLSTEAPAADGGTVAGTLTVPSAGVVDQGSIYAPGYTAASAAPAVEGGAAQGAAAGDGSTSANVAPKAFEEVTPAAAGGSDDAAAYAIAGGALLGGIALTGAAARRRKQH